MTEPRFDEMTHQRVALDAIGDRLAALVAGTEAVEASG